MRQQPIVNLVHIRPVIDRLSLRILAVHPVLIVQNRVEPHVPELRHLPHSVQIVAITLPQRQVRPPRPKHLLPEMRKWRPRRLRIHHNRPCRPRTRLGKPVTPCSSQQYRRRHSNPAPSSNHSHRYLRRELSSIPRHGSSGATQPKQNPIKRKTLPPLSPMAPKPASSSLPGYPTHNRGSTSMPPPQPDAFQIQPAHTILQHPPSAEPPRASAPSRHPANRP